MTNVPAVVQNLEVLAVSRSPLPAFLAKSGTFTEEKTGRNYDNLEIGCM